MTRGSSPLNAAQGVWFTDRFGVRYHHVQENADRPSRRDRRAVKHALAKRNDGTIGFHAKDAMRAAGVL